MWPLGDKYRSGKAIEIDPHGNISTLLYIIEHICFFSWTCEYNPKGSGIKLLPTVTLSDFLLPELKEIRMSFD